MIFCLSLFQSFSHVTKNSKLPQKIPLYVYNFTRSDRYSQSYLYNLKFRLIWCILKRRKKQKGIHNLWLNNE
ncbi:hypothetical protein bcere0018_54600 [Bacillus cereus Rock1-15]|nr:hypothetical protein bcere0018_54600 [Bacillus cereus Rock1-15]